MTNRTTSSEAEAKSAPGCQSQGIRHACLSLWQQQYKFLRLAAVSLRPGSYQLALFIVYLRERSSCGLGRRPLCAGLDPHSRPRTFSVLGMRSRDVGLEQRGTRGLNQEGSHGKIDVGSAYWGFCSRTKLQLSMAAIGTRKAAGPLKV